MPCLDFRVAQGTGTTCKHIPHAAVHSAPSQPPELPQGVSQAASSSVTPRVQALSSARPVAQDWRPGQAGGRAAARILWQLFPVSVGSGVQNLEFGTWNLGSGLRILELEAAKTGWVASTSLGDRTSRNPQLSFCHGLFLLSADSGRGHAGSGGEVGSRAYAEQPCERLDLRQHSQSRLM